MYKKVSKCHLDWPDDYGDANGAQRKLLWGRLHTAEVSRGVHTWTNRKRWRH